MFGYYSELFQIFSVRPHRATLKFRTVPKTVTKLRKTRGNLKRRSPFCRK